MQNCELFQSICEGGWEEEGGEGEERGVVAASTLRLYCKMHPIIYSCPSRTIIQLHTSAQLVIVFSACLSACLLSVSHNRCATR